MRRAILNFNGPLPLTDEEDAATLEALEQGIQAADEGRTTSLEDARKLIPEWISKFESRTKH
jgi:predicted transcriptional regulator